MSIEEKIKALLIENGMFDTQADEVIKRMKADEANESMAGCWGDDIEGHPPQLLAGLWLDAKQTALAYIEETCPRAFFKPMFDSA